MNECSSSSRLEIFIRKLKHRHCVYRKVSGLGHSSRICGEGGAENIQGKRAKRERGQSGGQDPRQFSVAREAPKTDL